jgi:hypothetical protein
MKPARTRTRTQLPVLHLCFERLRARPDWLESWLIGWALLLAWGAFAFLVVPAGLTATVAQAVFFAGLFPWILLPVVAASGSKPCGKG